MRVLEIHIDNCDEIISDQRRRLLGGEARKFADAGNRARTIWSMGGGTYWSHVVKQHERLYWLDCYFKRIARIKRQLLGSRPT